MLPCVRWPEGRVSDGAVPPPAIGARVGIEYMLDADRTRKVRPTALSWRQLSGLPNL
jgi:hypothetical protein